MSRFYDAMRRASEEKEVPEPDTDRQRPTPVKTDQKARVRPELDIEELAEEDAQPYSIPDIEFLDPVPIRPAPAARGGQAEAVQRSHAMAVQGTRAQPIHPSYERIIQRLLAFRGGRRHCVILVASAVSGEGASTVCRNLANAVAQNHDGKVVLVDANLRSPSQIDEETAGLSELLTEEVKLKEVLQAAPDSALTVLGSGTPSANPQHVFSVPRLQSVVTSLHSQFDWVFLDGPPITIFPDASSLAVVADGAILVVRAEQTRWEVADEAKKILNQSGLAILGGVLNRRKHHIPKFIYRRL